MYVYTPGQWALLFFFYCFCGWVWESCYVSAKQRHWVNRGFLHGPLLPIYGSGAIIILFATLPVADNFWLVYFLGMLAATALEYVVGAVMEQLFKVRYWDYTKQPFNLHGYICLTSSIAWGFFSDLLIYVIHPPIDKLLHKLPALLVNPLAAVIAVLFIMDTVKSTKAAIDLREVLTKLTEENAELRRLAKKAEAAQARTAEELQAFREKTSLDRYLLQSYLADELEAHRTAAPSAAFADLALSRSGSSAAGRLWKTPSAAGWNPSWKSWPISPRLWKRPAPRWTMASTNPASRSLPSIGRSWTPSSLPSAREKRRSAPAPSSAMKPLCGSSGPTPPPRLRRNWVKPLTPCGSFWKNEPIFDRRSLWERLFFYVRSRIKLKTGDILPDGVSQNFSHAGGTNHEGLHQRRLPVHPQSEHQLHRQQLRAPLPGLQLLRPDLHSGRHSRG